MLKYFIRRIISVIPILIVISIFVFLFVHLIPGDPARLVAGEDATSEDVAIIRSELGLDQPLHKQYFTFMGNLFKGDLGKSLKTRKPVTEEIGSRFMPTFTLTLFSMAWAVVFGLIIGVVSATNRNKWPDYLGMIVAVSGISLPSFWLGLMLIQLFSVKLGWFPTGGYGTFAHYILPSMTLGAAVAAVLARFTRSSFLEIMKEDYIRTARAKGLMEKIVVWKHAMRNALIPVITMIGLRFGFLLGGSIVVETVFSWPGLGRLLIDSVNFRDYPVIQSEILLFSLQFIIINLVVDLLYALMNPEIQYE
ncbi:MAG: glutathione ABC transporter permease GsiC [Marinisporobacter sp.]|nr:glutathione ABC transporter permease GsiC [Marinisporobacter sp.]